MRAVPNPTDVGDRSLGEARSLAQEISPTVPPPCRNTAPVPRQSRPSRPPRPGCAWLGAPYRCAHPRDAPASGGAVSPRGAAGAPPLSATVPCWPRRMAPAVERGVVAPAGARAPAVALVLPSGLPRQIALRVRFTHAVPKPNTNSAPSPPAHNTIMKQCRRPVVGKQRWRFTKTTRTVPEVREPCPTAFAWVDCAKHGTGTRESPFPEPAHCRGAQSRMGGQLALQYSAHPYLYLTVCSIRSCC